MNTYILIGGRSPDLDNKIMEDTILKIKPNAHNILFFPAIKDANKSFNNFQILFSHSKCDMRKIDWEMNIEDLKNMIAWADILYLGGGDTSYLYKKLTMLDISQISKLNKIIVGISAGANALCQFGMGDKYAYYDNSRFYNYQMVKGLGILNLTFCPHYQKEELVEFDDICKAYKYDALALEDNTMAIISDDTLKIVKANKANSAYILKKEKGYLLKPIYENEIYELRCINENSSLGSSGNL